MKLIHRFAEMTPPPQWPNLNFSGRLFWSAVFHPQEEGDLNTDPCGPSLPNRAFWLCERTRQTARLARSG